MSHSSTTHRTLSRRSLLTTTAGGLSALALGDLFGRTAHAAAKKSPTAKQWAAAKASRPKAAEVVGGDTKLSTQQTKLGQLLLQKSKHAFALAATEPTAKFQQGTLHFAAAGLLSKQTPTRVQRAKKRAAKLLAASSASSEANFGVYAKGTIAAAKVKPAPDVVLTGALRELNEAEKKKTKQKDEEKPKFEHIEFHLNSVECIEETDEVGADQILLGGQLIMPSGKIKTIDQFMVGSDFDEGDIKYFDYEMCNSLSGGGQVDLANFSYLDLDSLCPHGSLDNVYRGRKLAEGNLKTGTYGLVLVMGEQDSGGFGDVLAKIYGALEEEIDAAIEAASAIAGAAVGSFIPIPGLGTAIGAVLGWVAGKIIEWFLALFDNQDDLVAAKSWSVTFEKKTKEYIKGLSPDSLDVPNGHWASAMKKMQMKGDGGHYEARLHWRVSMS